MSSPAGRTAQSSGKQTASLNLPGKNKQLSWTLWGNKGILNLPGETNSHPEPSWDTILGNNCNLLPSAPEIKLGKKFHFHMLITNSSSSCCRNTQSLLWVISLFILYSSLLLFSQINCSICFYLNNRRECNGQFQTPDSVPSRFSAQFKRFSV